MKSIKQDQAGISLVELMITLTIISILSLVMMNFMVDWVQQQAITETRHNLLADAQNAIDSMGDSIRLSSAADQNNRWEDDSAPGAPSDLLSWESDATTLVLASAVEDTSGNIVFSDPASYTSQKNNQIYFIDGDSLYRRNLAAPVVNNKLKTTCPVALASSTCPADRLLTKNVQSFSVKYYNADNQEVLPTDARSIELSITLNKTRFSQIIQSVYKTRMVFRND